MSENYTVYMHRFPNGKVYIGITGVGAKNRWRNGKGYKENRRMDFAIRKYGWDNIEHVILLEGLTKEQAEKAEIDLIENHKSANPEYGYNIELGGNSTGKVSDLARKHIGEATRRRCENPEYRKKLSESHKGIKHTQEQKDKIGEAHRGMKRSQEAKKRMSEAQKKSYEQHPEYWERMAKKLEKQILQKSRSGELIKSWPSIKAACSGVGICSSAISNCCAGRSKTAGGFMWEYADK